MISKLKEVSLLVNLIYCTHLLLLFYRKWLVSVIFTDHSSSFFVFCSYNNCYCTLDGLLLPSKKTVSDNKSIIIIGRQINMPIVAIPSPCIVYVHVFRCTDYFPILLIIT